MKRVFQILTFACFAAAAICACLWLGGCATDPNTGKKVFDPLAARKFTQNPDVRAAADQVPVIGGVLALAGLVFGAMARHQSTSANLDLAKHTVNAITDALPDVPAPSNPAAPSTGPPKTA